MHDLDGELIAIGKVVKRYLGPGVHFVLIAKQDDHNTMVSTQNVNETLAMLVDCGESLVAGNKETD